MSTDASTADNGLMFDGIELPATTVTLMDAIASAVAFARSIRAPLTLVLHANAGDLDDLLDRRAAEAVPGSALVPHRLVPVEPLTIVDRPNGEATVDYDATLLAARAALRVAPHCTLAYDSEGDIGHGLFGRAFQGTIGKFVAQCTIDVCTWVAWRAEGDDAHTAWLEHVVQEHPELNETPTS